MAAVRLEIMAVQCVFIKKLSEAERKIELTLPINEETSEVDLYSQNHTLVAFEQRLSGDANAADPDVRSHFSRTIHFRVRPGTIERFDATVKAVEGDVGAKGDAFITND